MFPRLQGRARRPALKAASGHSNVRVGEKRVV